jgi:hypothetical protein
MVLQLCARVKPQSLAAVFNLHNHALVLNTAIATHGEQDLFSGYLPIDLPYVITILDNSKVLYLVHETCIFSASLYFAKHCVAEIKSLSFINDVGPHRHATAEKAKHV